MASFILEGFDQPVRVDLVSTITKEQLLNFKAFHDWKETLRSSLALQHTDSQHAFSSDPYILHRIEIQSVDWFGSSKIGFVKLKAVIRNSKNTELPGICFLRGGSVAMLMILRPKDHRDDRWVVMTEQPRVPAGSLSFVEIPAGMLDDSGDFCGKAAEEIKEETHFHLAKEELIDLTALALEQERIEGGEVLQNAMYPSPGGLDEFIPIFLWEKELERQEIHELTGKLTGKKAQGEMITLKVVPYDQLWRFCARDAKTLAAWALYEGLQRAEVLQPALKKRRYAADSLALS